MSSAGVTTAIKARYVFPVGTDPIPDGVVTLAGDRIVAVDRQPLGCLPRDLGNVAILPGLVNAHAHLEFSDLLQPLGQAGMPFPDWIRLVMDWRRARPPAQPPAPPPAVRLGLEECARQGVTTLAEIATTGWPADEFEQAAIEATIFLELIGLASGAVKDKLAEARSHLARDTGVHNWRAALSPHAPYTVHPEILSQAVSLSPVAMHLAESPEEIELLRGRRGPLVELLKELGAWHPAAFTGSLRPLDYLQVLSRADWGLVIHGNYLDEEEIRFLAGQGRHLTVVYCPRTHAYFGHPRHPLPRLLAAGASVAVGTDSRASNPDLGLLAELRFIARHYPEIPPRVVLELGTVRAARALGLPEPAGQLKAGGFADLAVVHLPDHDAQDPHELLFDSPLGVAGTVFRGRIVHGEHALAAITGSS
ncbi:MAG: amidohydrolase family protein [Pirellulales bacterium]